MSWLCEQCSTNNFGGNRKCANYKCKLSRPACHDKFEKQCFREILERYPLMTVSKTNEEKYELHAKFFAEETTFIKDKSYDEIEERIKELEDIIFRAKAFLSADTEKQRKSKADMTREQRDKLIDNPSLSVSDAISTVKKRADRMSKAEKLIEDMRAAGVDEAAIKLLMADVKVDEPKPNVLRAVFNKSSKEEIEKTKTETARVNDEPKASEPFDPTKLFG